MDIVKVPKLVRESRPDCQVVNMGPPQGVPDEECGTAEMLISQVETQMTGYPAKRQYAYFKPTEEEVKKLVEGGVIEFCQYGTVVQPFSAAVWPNNEKEESNGDSGDGTRG